MLKWFFYYKWLELKEWSKDKSEYLIITTIFLVSCLICLFITKSILNFKEWLGPGLLGGFLIPILLGVLLCLLHWIIKLTKENFEKAKEAKEIELLIKNNKCPTCQGDLKIDKPEISYQSPGIQCVNCKTDVTYLLKQKS